MIKTNKIRVEYEKGDTVRFLGHLDVSRVIHMAIRRAGWPVKMTEGFSPKMKVSFYSPLPVGTGGKAEYFDAEMTGHIITGDLKKLAADLGEALPVGFKVNNVGLVPDDQGSLEERINASEYIIDLKDVRNDLIEEDISGFISENKVTVEVNRGKGTKTVDVRPFLIKAQAKASDYGVMISMLIKHENGRTVRPQWILSGFSSAGEAFHPLEAVVDRTRIIYRSDKLP